MDLRMLSTDEEGADFSESVDNIWSSLKLGPLPTGGGVRPEDILMVESSGEFSWNATAFRSGGDGEPAQPCPPVLSESSSDGKGPIINSNPFAAWGFGYKPDAQAPPPAAHPHVQRAHADDKSRPLFGGGHNHVGDDGSDAPGAFVSASTISFADLAARGTSEPALDNSLEISRELLFPEGSFEDLYTPQKVDPTSTTAMPDVPGTCPSPFSQTPYWPTQSSTPIPPTHPMYEQSLSAMNEFGGYDPVLLAGTAAYLLTEKELKIARYLEKKARRQYVDRGKDENLSAHARRRPRDGLGRFLTK